MLAVVDVTEPAETLMFQVYRYLHAEHAIQRFYTRGLGGELSTCNVHIHKHSSKKLIRLFPLVLTPGGAVETLVTI